MDRTKVIEAIMQHYREFHGNEKEAFVKDTLKRLGDLELMTILHDIGIGDLGMVA